MKKIILFAFIASLSSASYAQFSFGAQLGANLGMGRNPNTNDVAGTSQAISDPKIGFMIGVLAEVGFGKFAFKPEVNFIQKGGKSGNTYDAYNNTFDERSEKFTLNYIEIPLNVVYNIKLRKAGKLFFGLGPGVGIGLSGTYKFTDYDNSGYLYSAKTKIKFDDKAETPDGNVHFKRVDVGANIVAGFKFSMGLFAKAAFSYGFTNISPYAEYKYENMGVNLCVGYMIGKKQ